MTNPYNKDAFITTYSSAGMLLKARRFGGVADDGGGAIAYDHQGNLYVTGTFQGTIDVDGHSLTGEQPSIFLSPNLSLKTVDWTGPRKQVAPARIILRQISECP